MVVGAVKCKFAEHTEYDYTEVKCVVKSVHTAMTAGQS